MPVLEQVTMTDFEQGRRQCQTVVLPCGSLEEHGSHLPLGTEAWRDILETPGDSHAGEVETSVMLHLHPQWVQGTAPEEYPTFPKHILVRNKRAFWPGGVWGNPATASSEKGRLLLERATQVLVDLVVKLENWSEPA